MDAARLANKAKIYKPSKKGKTDGRMLDINIWRGVKGLNRFAYLYKLSRYVNMKEKTKNNGLLKSVLYISYFNVSSHIQQTTQVYFNSEHVHLPEI